MFFKNLRIVFFFVSEGGERCLVLGVVCRWMLEMGTMSRHPSSKSVSHRANDIHVFYMLFNLSMKWRVPSNKPTKENLVLGLGLHRIMQNRQILNLDF